MVFWSVEAKKITFVWIVGECSGTLGVLKKVILRKPIDFFDRFRFCKLPNLLEIHKYAQSQGSSYPENTQSRTKDQV